MKLDDDPQNPEQRLNPAIYPPMLYCRMDGGDLTDVHDRYPVPYSDPANALDMNQTEIFGEYRLVRLVRATDTTETRIIVEPIAEETR